MEVKKSTIRSHRLDPSGIPDLFTLGILDSKWNQLPTMGFAGEFLDVSLVGGSSPQIFTFGSAPGSEPSLSAPVVQGQSTTPAPEPSALWLMFAGVLVFRSVAGRKKQPIEA